MSDVIPRRSLLPQYIQNASLAYKNIDYIAEQVAPTLDVASPRAKIWKYSKGAYFRDEAKPRTSGAEPNEIQFHGTAVSISTMEYDAAVRITAEDLESQGLTGAPPMKMKQDATLLAVDKLNLRRERMVSTLIKDTTWIDGNAGGEDAGGLWGASGSTNTFFEDIAKGKGVILDKTGIIPNSLMMDFETWEKLKNSDDAIARLNNSSLKKMTVDAMRSILELDRLVIGTAVYSSAEETQAQDDFTAVRVWDGNTAGKGIGFLYYAPMAPGLKVPSALYRPRHKVLGTQQYLATYEHTLSTSHSWLYQAIEVHQVLATGTDLGSKWTDTADT